MTTEEKLKMLLDGRPFAIFPANEKGYHSDILCGLKVKQNSLLKLSLFQNGCTEYSVLTHGLWSAFLPVPDNQQVIDIVWQLECRNLSRTS